MKRSILLIVVAVMSTGCIYRLVTSDGYTLESGDSLQGDLLIAGDNAHLEKESHVQGSVIMTFGSLEINGVIEGDLLMTSGNVWLDDGAVVQGDVRTSMDHIEQTQHAEVRGKQISSISCLGVLGSYQLGFFAQHCGLPSVFLGALVYLLISHRIENHQ